MCVAVTADDDNSWLPQNKGVYSNKGCSKYTKYFTEMLMENRREHIFHNN